MMRASVRLSQYLTERPGIDRSAASARAESALLFLIGAIVFILSITIPHASREASLPTPPPHPRRGEAAKRRI